MSYFSDIFQLQKSHWQVLIGVAVLVAACAGLVLWYGPQYDKPGVTAISRTAPIKLMGRDGTIEITCECPAYLITQQTREVIFNAVVKLDPAKAPAPPAGPGAPAATASTSEPSDVGLWVEPNKEAGIDIPWKFIASGASVFSKLEEKGNVSVYPKPQALDSVPIVIHLYHYWGPGYSSFEELGHVDFRLPVRNRFQQALQPVLYSALIFVLALVLLYSMDRKYRLTREQEEKTLLAARTKAHDNPDQVSPAWELAGANLEKYFARNLSQVRQVFYVSVGVMLAGFSFVLFGVYEQIMRQSAVAPTIIPTTWIASISGLITQFIGATFMVIYRSTMAQANEFVTVLDRINTVGIAMKVLDQIPDADQSKNSAREHLIGLLLASSATLPRAASRGKSKGKHADENTSGKAPASEKE